MTDAPQHAMPFDGLIEIAGRLIAVMSREVELLGQMQPHQIGALQEEKLALTRAYEERIKAIRSNPAALKALEPAIREELAAIAVRFNAALIENERALTAARTAHERVLKAIVEAVTDSRSKSSVYSSAGTLAMGAETGRRKGLSLTLDRKL